MFPSSPRVRDNVKVIRLGTVSHISLAEDDPDTIILEVFNTSFDGSKIVLPLTATIGKVFKFALVTDKISNPTMSTSYVDIVVPQSSGAVNVDWRMFSGQRPEFVYCSSGWHSSAGGALTNIGSNNTTDISIGDNANGSYGGVSIGRGSSGHTNGSSFGQGAVGHTNGSSFGQGAVGHTNGTAIGYRSNTNDQDKAVALGYYSTAYRYRELVKSADGEATSLQSWSMVNWYTDTTNATATEALLGGTAGKYCVLLNNSAVQFNIQIIAGVTGGGNTSSWTISGAIKRGSTAAYTSLVGVPVVMMTGQDAGASSWNVSVSADIVNGSLKLTVTGAAGTTIRWNATATLSEMRF